MSATIFVSEDWLFSCNSLAFETYKEWIREAFKPDAPVMKKVFEPVEEGFENRLYLDALNADQFNYFYRRLRSQDNKIQDRLRKNPALSEDVVYWNKLLDFIKDDDRFRAEDMNEC
jgi:hypothetical protein